MITLDTLTDWHTYLHRHLPAAHSVVTNIDLSQSCCPPATFWQLSFYLVITHTLFSNNISHIISIHTHKHSAWCRPTRRGSESHIESPAADGKNSNPGQNKVGRPTAGPLFPSQWPGTEQLCVDPKGFGTSPTSSTWHLDLQNEQQCKKKKAPLHTPSPHPRPKQSPLQLAWSSFTGQTAKLLMDMKRSVCSLFFMNVTVPNVAGWLPLGHSTLVLLSCLGVKSTAGLSAAC